MRASLLKPILISVAAFAAAVCVSAQAPETRDIDITVTLSEDGSAAVREVWDLTWDRTEWYLNRVNLGDIRITDLQVSDETGRQFVNEASWDVNRTLEQKAGRCGIVRKEDGCEICWGVGSHEPHVFTVQYRMSNVVKSLDDYDMLHFQFVSPGITPRPKHARVTVVAPGTELGDSTARIWAFGYEGDICFKGDSIVAETQAPFLTDAESVIVLARFDKGLFSPQSRVAGDFESHRQKAFEGSDYQAYLDAERQEDNSVKKIIAFWAAVLLAFFGVSRTNTRKRNKELFGVVKLKEIGYERELPFEGNLYETRYILSKVHPIQSEAAMASALILKLIKDGYLTVTDNGNRKVDIGFVPDADLSKLSEPDREFHSMLLAASGNDSILQHKEFSRWSRKNVKLVDKWVRGLGPAGAGMLVRDGYGSVSKFTDEGRRQARRCIGFQKFLKDFTLIRERGTKEVALWQDYIIYAALFGIADKVAKQLQDIDPQAFTTYVGLPYQTMHNLIYVSGNMGSDITGAVAGSRQSSFSVGGGGGHASFGGGGGFSGGGFGGGGR